MVAALIVATVADVALALLLIAVSGFVLQGVNNEGAMMPEAILFTLMIGFCLAAPGIGWGLRRARPRIALAVAFGPLAVAAAGLLLEPMFT